MYKTFAVVLMLVSGLAAMPANSHAVVGDNSNSGVGGNAAKNTAALGNRWCTLSLTDAVHQTYNINFSLLYLEDDNKYFEILDEGSPFAFPNLRAKASSYLGYDAAEFKFPTGQPAQIDITFYSISAEGLLTYHLSPSTVKGHGSVTADFRQSVTSLKGAQLDRLEPCLLHIAERSQVPGCSPLLAAMSRLHGDIGCQASSSITGALLPWYRIARVAASFVLRANTTLSGDFWAANGIHKVQIGKPLHQNNRYGKVHRMLARFLTAFLLICSVGQIVASDRGQQGVSPDDGTDGGSSSAGAPDIGIGKLGGGPCVLTATTTDTRVHKIAFAISYVDTVGVIANLISEKGGEFDAGTVYPHAFEYLKFRVAEFKFPKTQPAQLDLSFYYSPLDGSLAYHLSPSTVYNKGLTSWSLECNREPIPKLF